MRRGAIAIHAGGIALALASMQPDTAADLGALAIEIGVELTAPRVDQSAAMPGATTARFVVCAFEMPMKLFMMPHTVPNNPTEWRRCADGGEERHALPHGAGFSTRDLRKTRCGTFLDALVASAVA